MVEEMNCADSANFSHSLHALYTRKFVSLWLNAVLVDSNLFSGVVTTSKPHRSVVYADYYGSMLVAQRIRWDSLDTCCNNPYGEWKGVDKSYPTFNMECDRNLAALEQHWFYGPDF